MKNKAYYYFDTTGREILHLPHVFIIRKAKKSLEIELDPQKLRTGLALLKRNRKSLEAGHISSPLIPEDKINLIITECFGGREDRAESVCSYVFRQVGLRKYQEAEYEPDERIG